MTIVRHPKNRDHPPRLGTYLVAALSICIGACEQQPEAPPEPASRHVTIFAQDDVESIIRAAEAVSRESNDPIFVDLRTGASQSLAWSIEAGDIPDLYIPSSVEMAEELIPRPAMIEPWLINQLVIVARSDETDEVLLSDRALERSTGPVAIGGDGTPLGDFARLALRYAELWALVESRTTQRVSAVRIAEALRDGEVDLAILFASDVADVGGGLTVVGQLELPEAARIIFTRASFTDIGAEFSTLLADDRVLEAARTAGFTPARP